MGSFTELTLAFTFSPDAPPEVLGAFAEWRTGEEAPELLALDELLDPDEFDADSHLGNWFGEGAPPVASLPLPHRAALWQSLMQWAPNAYFPGTPETVMCWDLYSQRWKLTTRALPKMNGEWVQGIIAPLGEFATEGSAEQPRFVGYMLDEQNPRPAMIWSAGQQPFQIEGGFIDAVSDRDADALGQGLVTRQAGPAPPCSS